MSTNGERTEGAKPPAATGADPRGTGADARGGAASGRAATPTAGGGLTRPVKEAWGLLHDCERGFRYHAARSTFFDRCHRGMMTAVLLSGGLAVVFATPTDLLIAKFLMAVPILVGAIEAAWSLSRRAHVHSDLERRFRETADSIDWKNASEKEVAAARAKIREIRNSAPKSVYHALNAVCYNEATQAAGHGEEHFQRVSGWRKALRNWVRFSATDFPLKNA